MKILRPETVSLALVLLAGSAGAQDAPRPRPDASQPRLTDQLALARICASETGLTGAPEECGAIYEVLQDRMRRQHWTFLSAARRYSSSVFDTARTDPRAWVTDLSPHGRQPRGWPVAFVSWSSYGRPRWQSLYETAGRVIAGEVRHDCEMPPHFWGMRTGIDRERAVRFGWQEVACWVPCETNDGPGVAGEDGDPEACRTHSRNAFWAVPRWLADAD